MARICAGEDAEKERRWEKAMARRRKQEREKLRAAYRECFAPLRRLWAELDRQGYRATASQLRMVDGAVQSAALDGKEGAS